MEMVGIQSSNKARFEFIQEIKDFWPQVNQNCTFVIACSPPVL